MLQEVKDLDQSHGWQAQFQRINLESRENKGSLKAARLPKNRTLNRYRDVLPYDHSRIVLKDSDSDYINGNLVEVPSVKRYYILTQGPLPHTSKHFWQMVWEQRTIAIVMLNKVIEKNQVKCHQYFPDEPEDSPKCQLEFGNIRITNKRERHTDSYIVRHLYVENLNTHEDRTVYQFHYTAWPDFGTPHSSESFLEFLYDVRNSGAFQPSVGPTVVHCSAGIGRSGTFIVVDASLAEIERSQNLINFNVKNMIIDMRRYRAGLIQTPDQLRFSYITILEGCYHYMHALYYEAYWKTEGMEEPQTEKPGEEEVVSEVDSTEISSKKHSIDQEHVEGPVLKQKKSGPVDRDSSSSSDDDTEHISLEDLASGSSSDSLVSEDSVSSKSDDELEEVLEPKTVDASAEDHAARRPPMPIPQDQGDTSFTANGLEVTSAQDLVSESPTDTSLESPEVEEFEPLIEENKSFDYEEPEQFQALISGHTGISSQSDESEVILNQLVSDVSQRTFDSEALSEQSEDLSKSVDLQGDVNEPHIFENPYNEDKHVTIDEDEDSEIEEINQSRPYVVDSSSSSDEMPPVVIRSAQPYVDTSGPTVDIDFASSTDVIDHGELPELQLIEPSSEALTTLYSSDALPVIRESQSGEQIHRLSPELAEQIFQELHENEHSDDEKEEFVEDSTSFLKGVTEDKTKDKFEKEQDIEVEEIEVVEKGSDTEVQTSEGAVTVQEIDVKAAAVDLESLEVLDALKDDLLQTKVEDTETESLDTETPKAEHESDTKEPEKSISAFKHLPEKEVPSVKDNDDKYKPQIIVQTGKLPSTSDDEGKPTELKTDTGLVRDVSEKKIPSVDKIVENDLSQKGLPDSFKVDPSKKEENGEKKIEKAICSPKKQRSRSPSPKGKIDIDKASSAKAKKKVKSDISVKKDTDLSKTSSRGESTESSGTDESLKEDRSQEKSAQARKRRREERKKTTQEIVDNIKKKSKDAESRKKTTNVMMIAAAVAVCLVAVGAGVYFRFFRDTIEEAPLPDHYGL